MATSLKKDKSSAPPIRKKEVSAVKATLSGKSLSQKNSCEALRSILQVYLDLIDSDTLKEGERKVVFQKFMALSDRLGEQEVRSEDIKNEAAELDLKKKAKEVKYGIDLLIKIFSSIIFPLVAIWGLYFGSERMSIIGYFTMSGLLGTPIFFYGFGKMKSHFSNRKKRQEVLGTLPPIPSSI